MGSGHRVIVPDVVDAPTELLLGARTLIQFELCGIRAVQSTPLITRDGRVVGVISTHWRRVHTPDERELPLLDILARHAADFFERRRAQEALHDDPPEYVERSKHETTRLDLGARRPAETAETRTR